MESLERASVRCRPPGARYVVKGISRSPLAASRTVKGSFELRRSAKAVVNPLGMCCTMTTGGRKSSPNDSRTVWMASGPPVEAQ